MANDAFNSYKDLYFDAQAISSVYTWDLDNEGSFAAVILIKKSENVKSRLFIFECSSCGCFKENEGGMG